MTASCPASQGATRSEGHDHQASFDEATRLESASVPQIDDPAPIAE